MSLARVRGSIVKTMKSVFCFTAASALLCVSCVEADRPTHSAATPLSQAGASIQQIETFSETLPSGFRVVLAKTIPAPGQEPRAYVGNYVLHGTMEEQKLGLTHLMEHIVANNPSSVPGPRRPEGAKFFNTNALSASHPLRTFARQGSSHQRHRGN